MSTLRPLRSLFECKLHNYSSFRPLQKQKICGSLCLIASAVMNSRKVYGSIVVFTRFTARRYDSVSIYENQKKNI